MWSRLKFALWAIGPGILVAATGVGAGDLATGALAGTRLGLAVLWAVVVGAAMKFVVTEGIARWQLATGTTFVEGATRRLGRVCAWLFLAYLVMWSFLVALALMSACGVVAHAIWPLVRDLDGQPVAATDKVLYGVAHSVVAVLLVRLGGYWLFERVMQVCIGVMFVVAVATAIALQPDVGQAAAGLFWPTIPNFRGEGLAWTLGLIGGVGGTVTILCYGYWIREEGRAGVESLPACRIDLAAGYAMTAIFGLAMVVIGSEIAAEKAGSATLIVRLADKLQETVGAPLRWAFLLGAWSAVFSSLLGVWQSVPYLFSDLWRLLGDEREQRRAVDEQSRGYRRALYAIASLPALGLAIDFATVQLTYAIIGALFVPLAAAALLWMNGPAGLLPAQHRNRWWTSLALAAMVGLFVVAGVLGVFPN